MSVSIELKGAGPVLERLKKLSDTSGIQKVVAMNGAELQQRAQRKAPVATGQLRRSIQLDITDNGMTAVVSANTEYAAYVEYGTRFMGAQPYLRPALHEQAEQFKNDLERFAKGKGV